MSEHAIPHSATTRLLKRGGAERVSRDAADELAKEIEQHAAKLIHEAVQIAQREGRTTVRAVDLARAAEQQRGTNG